MSVLLQAVNFLGDPGHSDGDVLSGRKLLGNSRRWHVQKKRIEKEQEGSRGRIDIDLCF
jgi:hypothetical protein